MFGREALHRERAVACLLAAALTLLSTPSCSRASPPAGPPGERPDGEATRQVSSTPTPSQLSVAPQAAALQLGSATVGEQLFAGAVRFANGGPPCLSCHDIAGLPFPHGGVLGPDLTGSWAKYGPLALAPVLNTLFFPTMVPIFTTRPLTPAERGNLAAFLQAEAGRVPPAGTTLQLLAIAVGGSVVLLVLAWLAWPRRLGSARGEFLGRVGGPEEQHP